MYTNINKANSTPILCHNRADTRIRPKDEKATHQSDPIFSTQQNSETSLPIFCFSLILSNNFTTCLASRTTIPVNTSYLQITAQYQNPKYKIWQNVLKTPHKTRNNRSNKTISSNQQDSAIKTNKVTKHNSPDTHFFQQSN